MGAIKAGAGSGKVVMFSALSSVKSTVHFTISKLLALKAHVTMNTNGAISPFHCNWGRPGDSFLSVDVCYILG